MKQTKDTKKAAQAVPENPYLAARREWMERYGSFIQGEQMWRLIAFISIAVAVIACAGNVYIGAQSKFIPYVVEVDKLGDALAVRPATVAGQPDQRVVQASLARWVVAARTVYIDAAALRQNIDFVYALMANGSPAQAAMNDYNRAHNPFERAQREVVSVEVQPPMPLTNDTWRVEWTETVRPRTGGTPTTSTWEATITYSIVPATTPAGIMANPAGIFIKQFNWSQRL